MIRFRLYVNERSEGAVRFAVLPVRAFIQVRAARREGEKIGLAKGGEKGKKETAVNLISIEPDLRAIRTGSGRKKSCFR